MDNRTIFCAVLVSIFFSRPTNSFVTRNVDSFRIKERFNEDIMIEQNMKPIQNCQNLPASNFSRAPVITNSKVGKRGSTKARLRRVAEMSDEDREQVAMNFFDRFQNYKADEKVGEECMIKRMQDNYGIPTTGKLDDTTVAFMVKPRCGYSDTPSNYTFFDKEPKWKKSILSYKVVGYSPDINPCETRNSFRRAFRHWETAAELTFEEKSLEEDADIEIDFGFYKHGDSFTFDGEGDLLGHAFPPGRHHLAGDTHFDASEFWTLGRGPVLDTFFGNSNGAKCKFPFYYKGKKQESCVRGSEYGGASWCPTTFNYKRDKKYGLCPSPDVVTYGGTGGGRPCVFPFIYKEKSYDSCIMTEEKKEKKKWCSTTDSFDRDMKWGICPTEIDRSKGKGYSLMAVAAHEFGHALGLDHSKSFASLMYPTYKFSKVFRLSKDDIKGIRKLYGKRKSPLKKLALEKCGGNKID